MITEILYDQEKDEQYLVLPDELMHHMDWELGDLLEWSILDGDERVGGKVVVLHNLTKLDRCVECRLGRGRHKMDCGRAR